MLESCDLLEIADACVTQTSTNKPKHMSWWLDWREGAVPTTTTQKSKTPSTHQIQAQDREAQNSTSCNWCSFKEFIFGAVLVSGADVPTFSNILTVFCDGWCRMRSSSL